MSVAIESFSSFSLQTHGDVPGVSSDDRIRFDSGPSGSHSRSSAPVGSTSSADPAAATDTARTAPTGRAAFRFAKRLFDILFSLIVIVVGAIPLAVACIVIVADSPGMPLYSQERVGRGGRAMRIWKLRTMVANADDLARHLTPAQIEQWEREHKVDDDPRITRVGRFLRSTGLDELPQFWCVLKGDMSVIGPRPITTGELSWLGTDVDEYLSVRGGITGLWQVTDRNEATWESGERKAIELDYVRRASLALDARIFIATFGVMFGTDRTGR